MKTTKMESLFFIVFSFPWFSNACDTFLQRFTCIFVQLLIRFARIYMLICHPKGVLPVAPGGHLSHQPGKCMISYAHLQMQIQMQINGSGWFPMVSNASVWFQWWCRWFTQLFQHVSLAFKTSHWNLPRSTDRAIYHIRIEMSWSAMRIYTKCYAQKDTGIFQPFWHILHVLLMPIEIIFCWPLFFMSC